MSALIAGFASVASAAVVPTKDADVLASALRGSGVTVTGSSIMLAPPNGMTFATSSSKILRMPSSGKRFMTMSTGNASHLLGLQGGFLSAALGGANTRGTSEHDASILKIDFVAGAGSNCLSMDTRMMSEEFPEFPGKLYNDGFVAELDVNDWTTIGSRIIAPHNFAYRVDAPTWNGEPLNVRNTGDSSATAKNAAGTIFDGGTPLLQARTTIKPGPHSLYLSIMDQGDEVYDTVVMLDRLMAYDAPRGTCGMGAFPLVKPTVTRPRVLVTKGTTKTFSVRATSESQLRRIVVTVDGRNVKIKPLFDKERRALTVRVPLDTSALRHGRHTMTFAVANRAGTTKSQIAFTS